MWKAIKPRLDDKLLKAGSNDANSSNVATNEDVEMITVKNELQDDWEDTNEKKDVAFKHLNCWWMLATYELKYPFTQNKIFIQTPTQTTCDLKTFETNKIAKNEKWHPKIHNRFQLITKIFFFPSNFPLLKIPFTNRAFFIRTLPSTFRRLLLKTINLYMSVLSIVAK